jgi:hypothetical protein
MCAWGDCLCKLIYLVSTLFWVIFGNEFYLTVVNNIFDPVTWHHQRHPFIRALTCKTEKTRRGVAGGASSDDQISPVFVRRERERA